MRTVTISVQTAKVVITITRGDDTIVIEVLICLLTSDGRIHKATDPTARNIPQRRRPWHQF